MSDPGRIVWVNGPVVRVRGLAGVRMMDVVRVGESHMPGEVIRMDGDVVTLQVYEETAGLRPGEPVVGTGRPLSVELGPGLLGRIYDGIQRPLEKLEAAEGPFLGRGVELPALDREKTWDVTLRVVVGDVVTGGQVLAVCPETASIEHRVLCPPELSGRIVEAAPDGPRTVDETLVVLEDGAGKRHGLRLFHDWPVKRPRPVAERLRPEVPLVTGERILDTFFPMAKGGTAAIPGGFGTGKTMTQHTLAKWCDADVIVYIGCGERGNEMTQVLEDFPALVDPRTNRSLMERTLLIGNTSNMPVAAREASVYTGLTLAEYYRDQGYHVAVMADSTSRWAEAMREISGRLEEMPAEGGFPAYLPARLADFYERAGAARTRAGTVGSVTLIGAVSPPGGDFSEPVTQNTKRFTRCFWGLDRDLARQRHYPAISWLESHSDYAETLRPNREARFGPMWSQRRRKALELLREEARLLKIVKLVGEDALPARSRLILFTSRLLRVAFLQQNAFDPVDAFTPPEKQNRMLEAIMAFHQAAEPLVAKGLTLGDVTSPPSLARLWRMKTEVPNDDPSSLTEIVEAVRGELAATEARFDAFGRDAEAWKGLEG